MPDPSSWPRPSGWPRTSAGPASACSTCAGVPTAPGRRLYAAGTHSRRHLHRLADGPGRAGGGQRRPAPGRPAARGRDARPGRASATAWWRSSTTTRPCPTRPGRGGRCASTASIRPGSWSAAWRPGGQLARPISTTAELRPPATFTPRLAVTAPPDRERRPRSLLDSPGTQLLDARTPSEFAGYAGTTRRLGHIPGALNVPAAGTTEPRHGRLPERRRAAGAAASGRRQPAPTPRLLRLGRPRCLQARLRADADGLRRRGRLRRRLGRVGRSAGSAGRALSGYQGLGSDPAPSSGGASVSHSTPAATATWARAWLTTSRSTSLGGSAPP